MKTQILGCRFAALSWIDLIGLTLLFTCLLSAAESPSKLEREGERLVINQGRLNVAVRPLGFIGVALER